MSPLHRFPLSSGRRPTHRFHRRCDRVAPTVTLVRERDGGWLFGAYTAAQWTSDGTSSWDDTAFVFSITNPHGRPPAKFDVVTPEEAVCGSSAALCPTFGAGADLRLWAGGKGTCRIGHSYRDVWCKGAASLTGAPSFVWSDVYVYGVCE